MNRAPSLRQLLRLLAGTAGIMLFAIPGIAQQVEGPVLGFVMDGTRVRPISGTAGAAAMGAAISLPLEAATAVVAPGGAFLVAIAAGSGTAEIWIPQTGALLAIPSVAPGASRIILSPTGSAAAFYHESENRVQVVTGLPGISSKAQDFLLTPLRNPLGDLAVSDDGALLLCAEAAHPASGFSPAVVVLGAAGDLNRFPLSSPATVIAFAPKSHDALAVSDGEAILVRDAGGSGQPMALAADGLAGATAAAFSANAGRAYFLRRSSHLLYVYDFALGGTVAKLECECHLDGLERMGASETYRLTNYSGAALRILDGTAVPPRIAIVPPATDSDKQP